MTRKKVAAVDGATGGNEDAKTSHKYKAKSCLQAAEAGRTALEEIF
jgi:hypothetical protein